MQWRDVFPGRFTTIEPAAAELHATYSGCADGMTMVLRFSPHGAGIFYYLGLEVRVFVRGPIGTYSDFADPESGNTLRYEIVQDGITLTVPAGTYSNVARMHVYCMTCGPDRVLLERHYLSAEVAFPVRMLQWDAQHACWSRWHSLVSVTTK